MRIHGTTGQSPLERLLLEQPKLQPLPQPWRASLPCACVPTMPPPSRFDNTPLQHQLSVYEALLTEAR